nr:hypothetical protein [Tanacetum cinerariifolium]
KDDGDNGDDGDNDDDAESDDHNDDSDDERTKSDSDEILDLKLSNEDQTEYEEEDVDEGVRTPSGDEFTVEKNLDDEETMDDEVFKELYEDVNVNLEKGDAEMTEANQRGSEQQNASQESRFEQEEEDTHVILSPVSDAQKADEPIQSSFISSNFTIKFLNLENPSFADNEIASLMETSAPHFDQRVSVLESEMYKLKQTSQFSKVVSSIPSIIDKYLASKMKEAVNVAVQLQTNKIREEAQAKNQDFINQANKSINRSDTQKNLYNALVESYNSKKDIITSYGDVVLLKRGRDDEDKDEDPFVGSDRGMKRGKSGKDVESSKDSRSKETKSLRTSKDASQSQHKSFGKSVHAEEPSHTVEESGMQHQIIPKDYFLNKDLGYLKGGDSSRRYSTSMMKTKAATYELKWIEDLVLEF